MRPFKAGDGVAMAPHFLQCTSDFLKIFCHDLSMAPSHFKFASEPLFYLLFGGSHPVSSTTVQIGTE